MKKHRCQCQAREQREALSQALYCSRRNFLRSLGAAGVMGTALEWIANYGPFIKDAQAESAPTNVVVILYSGGPDVFYLGVDPITAPRLPSLATFYNTPANGGSVSEPTRPITGKTNVVAGPGLFPAISALQNSNVTVIKGVDIYDVTSHQTAAQMAIAGPQNLSPVEEYASFTSLIAKQRESLGFPSFVSLGMRDLLGNKGALRGAKPLAAPNASSLLSTIQGPNGLGARPQSTLAAQQTTAKMDKTFQDSVAGSARNSLGSWLGIKDQQKALFARGLESVLQLDTALQTEFEFTNNAQPGAQFALTYLGLRHNLSTVFQIRPFSEFNYDSHSDHPVDHPPKQTEMARLLSAFLNRLRTTPHPAGGSLADKTVVILTGDFGRTPLFNIQSGTDHWPVGFYLFLSGTGGIVQADSVVGSTVNTGADIGKPQSWLGAPLNPQDVVKTLLSRLGYTDLAAQFSGRSLGGIFT